MSHEYIEPKRPEEMVTDELVARVHALESALYPFAQVAVAMADARTNLAAVGRESEPAGGHWINNIKTTAMTPSEVYFYQALTVAGRANVESKMISEVDRVAMLTTAQEQRVKTVDAGGRTDH